MLCDKGINNWADYSIKYQPTKYHRSMRSRYAKDHRDEQCDVEPYIPFSRHVYCKGMLIRTWHHNDVINIQYTRLSGPDYDMYLHIVQLSIWIYSTSQHSTFDCKTKMYRMTLIIE